MSSITAQLAKLDLELVPKEKRLKIGKCNGRLNRGKIQREPTFQVVLDALALTPCYYAFLITTDEINSLNDVVVDHMHQPWRTFATLINKSLSGKKTGLDQLRLSRAQILWGQESLLEKQDSDAHSKDDYLINTLTFLSTKEATQTYGAILLESLTSPEMKETKAYKTYLVSSEELTKKSKRVKRSAKKSTKAPAGGVVIRETPKMPLFKKKEKVDVARGKGIELLFKVALTEEAMYEEGNDEDENNNEKDSRSKGSDEENDNDDKNTQSNSEKRSDSKHETDENELDSESNQEENEEEIGDDEEEEEDEFVRTTSNDSDDETKIYNKAEGNKNQEISQVIEDAYVTLFTVPQKNEFPVTSSSQSSDLASKLLNFLDIPNTEAEIISPIDVHVHHEEKDTAFWFVRFVSCDLVTAF
nr:hypothetical protein [Tanacetum cinerariifolium]